MTRFGELINIDKPVLIDFYTDWNEVENSVETLRDVAAALGDKGDSIDLAATVTDGVSVYQITKNGLALQVTLQGTKYYKDKKVQ